MKTKHKSAVERLRKALENCNRTGLKGGVWDGTFYVWPVDAVPDPRDQCSRFFDAIRDVGGSDVFTLMNLDGGAGV